jgi:hypothetical protein
MADWGAAFGSAYDRNGLTESFMHCEWSPGLMEALSATLHRLARTATEMLPGLRPAISTIRCGRTAGSQQISFEIDRPLALASLQPLMEAFGLGHRHAGLMSAVAFILGARFRLPPEAAMLTLRPTRQGVELRLDVNLDAIPDLLPQLMALTRLQMTERPRSVHGLDRWLMALTPDGYPGPGTVSVLSVWVWPDLPARIALFLRPAALTAERGEAAAPAPAPGAAAGEAGGGGAGAGGGRGGQLGRDGRVVVLGLGAAALTQRRAGGTGDGRRRSSRDAQIRPPAGGARAGAPGAHRQPRLPRHGARRAEGARARHGARAALHPGRRRRDFAPRRAVTLAGNAGGFAPQEAATALAGPVTNVAAARRFVTAPRPPPIGEAARQGGAAMSELIQEVDFPAFVGGLVDGVFNSIITSSIKQMEAYAELVKNVAKTVEQYMKDNVSENNARDYLVDRYPEALELDLEGDAKVRLRRGADEASQPDFAGDLGMPEKLDSLDDDAVETKLVPAARRRMAMDRQQMLATMVMMGVNRLVVTNGTIEASCLFELNTTDAVRRRYQRRSAADFHSKSTAERGHQGSYSRSSSGFLGLGTKRRANASWYSKSTEEDSANFSVTTNRSEDSESKVQLHARLAGKVNVQFRSDYFPMERMIDVMQINQIRSKTAAAGAEPAAPGQQPLPPGQAAPPRALPAPAR